MFVGPDGDRRPFRERVRGSRGDGTGYGSWNVRFLLAVAVAVLAIAFSAWRHSNGDTVGAVFGAVVAVVEIAIAAQLGFKILHRNRDR